MRGRFSQEDRAAFFDARLAAIHAGLRLNADQEKLWPPVETAARDLAKQTADLRDRARTEGRPANPVDRMRRRGEASSAMGAALTRLADAAEPLWNTLSDEQKRRYPMLARGMMGDRHMGMHRDGRGRGRPEHRDLMRRGGGAPPSAPEERSKQHGDAASPGLLRFGEMGPVDRFYP
jgi:hypothetical protein